MLISNPHVNALNDFATENISELLQSKLQLDMSAFYDDSKPSAEEDEMFLKNE